jgi:hypothetical protein
MKEEDTAKRRSGKSRATQMQVLAVTGNNMAWTD